MALTNGTGSVASFFGNYLTNGTQMLALNIYNTFYGRTGWEGVGQGKAVIFFILVVGIGLLQLRATRSKEVQQ